VLFDSDWSRRRTLPRPFAEPPVGLPVWCLCVAPPYRPQQYDWRVVAGVPVDVVVGDWRGRESRAGLGGLLGDLAREAAPVVYHTLEGFGRAHPRDVADVAWAARTVVGEWPRWWSDKIDADYRARRDAYDLALARDVMPEAFAS